MDAANDTQPAQAGEPPAGPARELTLHLLRMLETRADAAGVALQTEIRSFSTRLRLRIIAGLALFLAVWAGIVLLAIVLPAQMRVPVLSAVVAALAIAGVWALFVAKRNGTSHGVGSMPWFLDSLRLDLEVLSRTLASTRVPAPAAREEARDEKGQPDDLAA